MTANTQGRDLREKMKLNSLTFSLKFDLTYPGEDTRPLSSNVESNCVTQTPTLSPCMAFGTDFLNICMDLIFRTSFNDEISMF
jgi:hypothetical protein